MTELTDMMDAAPRFRRTASEKDLKRPFVIYCWKKETDAALAWAKVKGGQPESLYFLDDGRAGLVPLANRPGITIIVYGRQERRKGLTLAHSGIREFLFAKDPGYRTSRCDPDYYTKNRENLETLFARLVDDESRWTLASVLRHRTTRDCGYLRIATYPEYFHPTVRAMPGDVVIDAGAYDGRTTFAFADAVGSTGKVYGFEPDPANVAVIAAQQARTNVEIVQAALSDKPGILPLFFGKAGSSGTTGTGEHINVAANSIDGFLDGKRCNLVSLDVEGAEPHALRGAAHTIETLRPKLQISVYHAADHLYTLPLSLDAGYDLYMGHHNTYSTETDVYAMPA